MKEFLQKAVNVHLVDDDEFYLKIFKNKFQTTTDYVVHTYSCGEDFLKELKQNPIPGNQKHVVILDYYLRTKANQDALDGNEVLREIKLLYPDMDVIMLSGTNEEAIVDKAIELGAFAFIKKNENSFLRIHNNIKRSLSKNRLKKREKSTKLIMLTFLSVAVIVIGLFFIMKHLNPERF